MQIVNNNDVNNIIYYDEFHQKDINKYENDIPLLVKQIYYYKDQLIASKNLNESLYKEIIELKKKSKAGLPFEDLNEINKFTSLFNKDETNNIYLLATTSKDKNTVNKNNVNTMQEYE